MLPLTRRIGFSMAMSVVYRPDFRMESDGVWVWGRFERFVTQPDLRIVGVENPVVNLATRTPAGDVATLLGQGIVAGEIGKGFTVVHQDDGDDFALGHLEPPEKPKRQFAPGADRVVLASDLVEVRPGAREFLGPFTVPSDGAALYLRARADNGPLVYGVVERSVGDAWRRAYEAAQPMGPPPGPVLGSGSIAPGDASLKLPLAKGAYYVVFDNQATAAAPFGVPLPVPETVTYLSYSAEVGDR
jgi:hypothetical protein